MLVIWDWLDPEDKRNWSKIRVGRELSTQYPRARQRGTGQFSYCKYPLEGR